MTKRVIPYQVGNVVYLAYSVRGVASRTEREAEAAKGNVTAEIIQLPKPQIASQARPH